MHVETLRAAGLSDEQIAAAAPLTSASVVAALVSVGWSAVDAEAYAAAAASLAEEQDKLATIAAERAARAASPLVILQKVRDELAAAKRERERAERLDAGERAERRAREEHGHDRVEVVSTVAGPIVLRAMTGGEVDDLRERTPELSKPEAERLARNVTLGTVVHPPRAEVMKILDDYPGVWSRLFDARDRLIDGVERDVRGKA